MLHRFILAATFVAVVSGVAYSETFLATIVKVEGNKVTYKKATFHRDKTGTGNERYSFAEPVTVEVAKDAAITMGHFLPLTDKPATSEARMTDRAVPIEGGLNHKLFKNINAGKATRPSLITIADKG